MKELYHLGKPQERGGWVAGHFMPLGSLAHTDYLEIKEWYYSEPFDYGEKKFDGTEWFNVEGGALRVLIRDGDRIETVDLHSEGRACILLPPGTVKTVQVLKWPAWGVTVRWPSATDNNKIVKPTVSG